MPDTLCAQFNHMWEDIAESMHHKPVVTCGLDGKNTMISGRGVPIRGFELGLNFNSKISYMVGIYFLKRPLNGTSTINKGTVKETTLNTLVKVNFVSLIAEYTVYKKGRWTVYMPVQIGLGSAIKEYRQGNTLVMAKKNSIAPVEIAITGNYRIWKFIGVCGGMGFRNALGSNIIKDEDFNGITYSLGVKIYFGELCTLLLPQCKFCEYL